MKQLTVALICLLGLSLTQCGGPAPEPGPTPPGQVSESPEPGILLGTLPEGAAPWAQAMQRERGAFRQRFGDWDAYMISMGEQPTGGFAVEFVQADFSGAQATVDLRYIRPGTGAIVVPVLTYPYYVFAVPTGTQVTIRLLGEGPEPHVLEVQGR